MNVYRTLLSRLIATSTMLSIMAFCTHSLSAQTVDRLISYQGLLMQATGEPLADGEYRLVLRLYDSPTVGSLVFSETQDVIVTKGLFTVLIGQVETAAIASVNFNQPLWLETSIEGESPFSPRTRLAMVPNAVVAERAAVAESLSPSYTNMVKSLNGAQGDLVIKGSNGIIVNRIQDTIRISGTTQNGNTAIETITSNDGSIAVLNPNGPDAIVRVADGGITASKLASGSVVTTKLAEGAVTGDKIANGVITSAKIAAGVIPTSLPPNGPASGDLIGTYPSPLIRSGSVTTDKLANGGVVEGKIADGAITSAKITAGGVTTSRLQDGAVTTAKLQPTGVTPGTYGDFNKVVQMTVDTSGRIVTARSLTLTGIQPGGPAAGDLTGIYPFPEINRNVAGTNIIASINDNMNPLLWVDGMKVEPLADIAASDIAAAGRIDSANFQIKQGAVGPQELADIAGLPVAPQGSGTLIPVITVDGDGRVQSLTTTVITGAPPVGPAGGDLAGTYPSPTINVTAGNNVVTAINNGSTTLKINAPHIIDPVASGASDITTTGNIAAMNMQIGVGVVGAPELANLHGSAIGPIGTATTVPVISIDTDGRVTALTNTTITGVTPGGAAGGDLTGTYPNPTLGTAAATGGRIVDAVRTDYIAGDADINKPQNLVVLDASGNLPTVNQQTFNDGDVATPYVSFLQPPATTTSTRVWTLPDATGTVVVAPNAGTISRIPRFGTSSTLVDGSIDDNGTGTLSRAGNLAINVGTGHVLSTNGALSAAEGLSVTGTTALNTTGAAETRIGHITGGSVHIDATSVIVPNLPAASPTDDLLTMNASGSVHKGSISSIIGGTTWLLSGNSIAGAGVTRALGLTAQTSNEDNLGLYTDGVERLHFRGSIDTADVSVSMVPTSNNAHALGSDNLRWSSLFVNGTSLHIGPSGGAAGNTELRLGYLSGTASLNVDGGTTPEMSISAGNVVFDAQTDVNGELNINAAQTMKVLVGAAPFFPGTQDHIIVITAHAAVDVTLPTAPAQGRIYTIRNAAGGVAIVAAGGTDTIEGQPQVNLANGATARFVYGGGGIWYNVGN